MQRQRVFISSVQSEFAAERQMLFEYLTSDALLEKPIPSYHIYDGDVFELIDQAVSFVMSRIDAKVGDRDKTILADVEPELPLQAVTEAIVNAVCHRDYTSNASVQVMLFKNRLEIWNPGQLPYGLTVDMLKTKHASRPANPLLARPMYLFGSIEQVGTGTEMIVEKCVEKGLQYPEFEQDENFTVTIWRNEAISTQVNTHVNTQVSTQVSTQVDTQVNTQVKKIIQVFKEEETTLQNLMQSLNLRERGTFFRNYIQPALKLGLIEMTIPDKPKSRLQKYRLTEKGLEYLKSIS